MGNTILRDSDGAYLAVSSRGNFYLTYRPGDEYWVPHNRETSRRITSMGFVKDHMEDGLWMSTAGGEISKTPGSVDTQLINIPFGRFQIKSGGYGILDVAFLPGSSQACVLLANACRKGYLQQRTTRHFSGSQSLFHQQLHSCT